MDCDRVRQEISARQQNRRLVRQHLRDCSECRAFQQRLQETEAMMARTLPFSAPEALTQRLLAMVPQAAQQLRAQATEQARVQRAVRPTWTRQALSMLLALGLCTTLLFWYLVLGPLQPAVQQVGSFLPALPEVLAYWGGRLGEWLAPIYSVLQLLALCAILALGLEYAMRTVRSRSAATN
jgi:predicted anti-sigma-YlaC factor YlaD